MGAWRGRAHTERGRWAVPTLAGVPVPEFWPQLQNTMNQYYVFRAIVLVVSSIRTEIMCHDSCRRKSFGYGPSDVMIRIGGLIDLAALPVLGYTTVKKQKNKQR